MSRSTVTIFYGERLRQAREVRQMTATALAERIGVTAATVTTWEKGRAQPRSEALRDAAHVLELPEPFFLRPPSKTAPESFRFRSLSAATKRARAAAQGRAQWLHEIVEFLESELDLPIANIPLLAVPADPRMLAADDIENAAEATRRAWGLRDGPLPNIDRLLEAHGVAVGRLALNAAELDGLSGWSRSGRPYVILNNEKANCVRSRFDAAHELAHLVLHREAPLRPDAALHKLMERQAHHFAGAFIFPRAAVLDEVAHSDLDSLVRLKERWRLSVAAQIFRLFQLDLIDEQRKSYLYRQLGARGWRSWEPLDDELPLERPTMVRNAYHLLCEEAGWSPADITRAVPFADHDHELLAGLPSRWMQGHHRTYGELVKLRPAENRVDGDDAAAGAGGKLLRFPGPRAPEE